MKKLLILLLIPFAVHAKDVQWAQGYTANCDNATEREDGTALPLNEIASVHYLIIPASGGEPIYTMIMTGGCNPMFVDTHQFVPAGNYLLHGITVDTEGRQSVMSTPGNVLTVIKARPKPPTGLR